MTNGDVVKRFESAFSEYVGAEFCIGLANGTSTIHTALAVLGAKGSLVCVPPLTMAATTIAVLHAGGIPRFCDIDPDTWLMVLPDDAGLAVPVSLYGLHWPGGGSLEVDDAAQTLRPHGDAAFTSWSFQASKHLTLGEGGMLGTNNEDLARKARAFSSLGYDMSADTSKIDPATLKHPTYARHHSLGWNYRMADAVAEKGLYAMGPQNTYANGLDCELYNRANWASRYRQAIDGCEWITPQHVPDGWTHDYWCYAVALESAELWEPFTEAIVRHGGERPFGAWRLTYREPAFFYIYADLLTAGVLSDGRLCPIAEDLQPRLVQAQTNNVQSAITNADAWAKAIREMDG